MPEVAQSPADVPPEDVEQHMAAVKARHESHAGVGQKRLIERVQAVNKAAPLETRERLRRQAMVSRTVAQRVTWLRREADLVVDAAQAVSPCAKGCSHCCHIGVLVAEPEAVEIGRAMGRKPVDVPKGRYLQMNELSGPAEYQETKSRIEQSYLGVPCVFLKDGRCSIYQHRPLACRHLVNFDDDDLLCRLVPGQAITVPYADMRRQQLAYVSAMGVHARMADLRDWFPINQ